MLAPLILVLSPVAMAAAQQPVAFELQPGISIADFVSVPHGTESTTAFSLRFATRFPVNRWFNPVVGGVFRPYGSTGASSRNTDAPTLFAGNVMRLVPAARATGWFSVELPLLVTHAPGAGASGNLRDYGRDLVVLPTVLMHVGARGLGELGPPWSRFDVLVQVEQNLTPNRDTLTGKRDRFNPVATVGLSLSVGMPGRSD
ncbi:MAG: hypothetical protein HUU26_04270 [Gemmatimonadaceae bacterium]|nr:hypothetical protein [Gemmatimonadaceae bacterium]